MREGRSSMRTGRLALLGFAVALLSTALFCSAQKPEGSAGDSVKSGLEAIRDPFWPVGWEPPEEEEISDDGVEPPPGTSVRWDDAKKRIRITGLSKNSDGEHFAILKSIGVVEAGDVIAVTLDDLVYKWRVTRITNKGMVPEKVGVFPKK
jgi:hypothetical protein